MEHNGSQLERLKERLQRVPRLALGYYPTPLVEAKVLSKVLGGPRIFVKRDDLSGLALGGNKCRHIEFLMGYAKKNGYDIIVYGRGHKRKTQSNYAVQLTSAAQKAGIDVKIYMRGGPPVARIFSGNDLLQQIIAPEITWINEPNQETFVLRILEEAQKLKSNGRNPWVMQTMYQNSTSIEQTGWVNAAGEIYEQLQQKNIKADYLIVANSQGGTQAGLIVGAKYLRAPFKVIGISAMFKKEKQIVELARMANETAKFLNLNIQFSSDELIVYDEYMGEGYGTINDHCREAIRLVSQTEGIFLDPVYTGKAMAGLIDLIRKKKFRSHETIVFLHTGGIPAIFDQKEGI